MQPPFKLRNSKWCSVSSLTLNATIATKVVCFSCLLKCLRSLYGKQCGPRSDCSYRSSLFWVHTVCFYTRFFSNARQLFAVDNFSRQHFQMHFFLGALRVNNYRILKRPAKALISLRVCAGWSEPLLVAYTKLLESHAMAQIIGIIIGFDTQNF